MWPSPCKSSQPSRQNIHPLTKMEEEVDLIAGKIRRLPWKKKPFGAHVAQQWRALMRIDKPWAIISCQDMAKGTTPFGDHWPSVQTLFTQELTTQDELLIRYVLCSLMSNVWGDGEDVAKWSKHGEEVDRTIGAGPLMAIATSTWHTYKREGFLGVQCPTCNVYIPPRMALIARDTHVGNCGFNLAKIPGMDLEDLAMACVDVTGYRQESCEICNGVFYGAELHHLGHRLQCDGRNQSFRGAPHSSVVVIYLDEFNALVSIDTPPPETKPRDQTKITQFLEQTTSKPQTSQATETTTPSHNSASQPMATSWDESRWSKEDAIYRKAYESCCILDDNTNVFNSTACLQHMIDLCRSAPPEGSTKDQNKWIKAATQNMVHSNTFKTRGEYFPFTYNFLIQKNPWSTRNKQLKEYLATRPQDPQRDGKAN